MADDRFASVADALLRIESARSLEEAVRIARDAQQRTAQPTSGFDGDAPFRYLFDQNPTPMWVYELGSLAFLEVNQAAIQNYGYTRADFLGMRITDIRPAEDVPKLLDLTANRPPGLRYVGKWRHRLKSGVQVDVDISSATIEFGGRPPSWWWRATSRSRCRSRKLRRSRRGSWR
jgi:PAS domain S-box-containing protein